MLAVLDLRCSIWRASFSGAIAELLIPCASKSAVFFSSKDEHDMEVDTAASSLQASAKHPLPELEIYCYLLVLILLIDQKKYNEVTKACTSTSIVRLKNVNRRTVDVLAARLYFYYSLSYELLTGDLAEIRGNLLALHRIATYIAS
ncbi:hypothetical protein SLE2022_015120 [Rubroshorea leprosula]